MNMSFNHNRLTITDALYMQEFCDIDHASDHKKEGYRFIKNTISSFLLMDQIKPESVEMVKSLISSNSNDLDDLFLCQDVANDFLSHRGLEKW